MDHSLILRSGKYQGYTVGEVSVMDPRYLRWIRENRPEMLRAHKKATPKPVAQKQAPVDPDMAGRKWANQKFAPGDIEDAF